MHEIIAEDEFNELWGVYSKPSGDLFWFEEVCDEPLSCVWTVVETGNDADGSWYASPGFHIVNVCGYVMTKKPWSNCTPDAIYFFDDVDAKPD